MSIDGGHTVIVEAGKAPIVDGRPEVRMRVGCGSATVGIFARQWLGHVDEVIVVDDHITGVLTEHQSGRVLDMPLAGIRVRGRKSTPGRYFQVANPGLGWGGTDITEPLSIIQKIDPKVAWPGLRLLMTSTTGEDALYCVLDETLRPVPADMPAAVRAVVERIGENCEPSLCTVLFMAGAGGSLRAGVTENPVLLTRSVAKGETRVTMGGAPVYVWPGGGITVMADVTRMPKNAFGYVPTPAIVAPMEFTLPRALYERLGGHSADIVAVGDVIRELGPSARIEGWQDDNPWPFGDKPCHPDSRQRISGTQRRRTSVRVALGPGSPRGRAPAGMTLEQCWERTPMAIAKVRRKPTEDADAAERAAAYVLEDQVGFLLRCAHQRATEIFNAVMGRFAVTPTQFAALAKLDDLGSVSQNQLGRLTRMDPATVSGVVGRLIARGFVRQSPDARDARLVLLALTPAGRAAVSEMKAVGAEVSRRTLEPLKPGEADALLRALAKIG